MPDNVVGQLSYDQFIDLVAFLKDREAPGVAARPGAGLLGRRAVRRRPGRRLPAGDEAEPGREVPRPKAGEKLTWQPRQAEPTGLLNLRALFNRDQTLGLRADLCLLAEGAEGEMLLGAGDTLQVWVNGKLVHEHAERRPARPDEDRVAVELKQGWNTVLVKVVNADADTGCTCASPGPAICGWR